MIPFLTFVVCVSVFSYVFYRHLSTRLIIPKGLKELPSEKGFPLLGIFPQIKPPLANYLWKLGKKHGHFYKIRLGLRDIVVLNNFDVTKKCLKENGNAFSGRIKFLFVARAARDSGIILTDGEKWAKQRSFILSVLRDFGLGRVRSQEIVQSECHYLIEELKSLDGKWVDFAQLSPIYTANIMSKFIMNKRFSREDPKFLLILKVVMENSENQDFLTLFQIMFPFLDFSKVFDKLLMTISSRWHRFDESHLIFKEEIEEHRKRLNFNSEGEDLIDRFLIKQNELKEKLGSVDTFTDFQLIRNSLELHFAGYETTTTTLVWTFFFMCRFPNIQEKVYLEITDNIGYERMVTMNDRKYFHYTQAVMDEVMRLSSIAPLGFGHRTWTNTNINGYFIPKDSVIFPNILGCHMDSETWPNPKEFKPERFLSVDDDGKLKYSPREELIPFSMGKRQCVGESLARLEYLIFFVTILQKFKVSSEFISETKYKEVLRGNDGFIRFCKIKDFIFSTR